MTPVFRSFTQTMGTTLVAGALWSGTLGSGGAQAQDATVSYEALTPELALELAQATLDACRERGFQIAVAVVDRSGLPQVILRDRYAGIHTVDTATRKAWTAASFKTSTLDLSEVAKEGGEMWALRVVTNALPLGGGIFIENGEGALLGAVGVSGAPGGEMDHECAKVGLSVIEDQILF